MLDLEGLWTRYEDPEPLLAEVTELDEQAATRRLQAMYAEPISEDLIGRRIEEIARLGVISAASCSAAHRALCQGRRGRGVDIFVIAARRCRRRRRAEPLTVSSSSTS